MLDVDRSVPDSFRAFNARRKAWGSALRAAVRAIDEAHVGAIPLSAWDVRSKLDLQHLERHKRPTLRTVQLHLKAVRDNKVT